MMPEIYNFWRNLVMGEVDMILKIPLEELLTAIELADTAGPILDPTLYRKGAAALQRDREIIEVFLQLQKVVKAALEKCPLEPKTEG
jgi:hypothetical protein